MKKTKHFIKVIISFATVLLIPMHVVALPKLDSPVELPAKFSGIITIYPDNDNTLETRRYWLVPSIARIVRDPSTKKLAFGLIHSGISSYDPDGVNALLTITVQPYVDDVTLQEAKSLISTQATSEGAKNISFNFIAPTEMSAQLLVGGQRINWLDGPTNVIHGGTVESGFPFQVRVDKSFDVRCVSQSGGDDANSIGAEFLMKFKGVGAPVHFTVDADLNEVYTHFKAQVQASGWWGAAKVNAKTEWQDLQTLPSVKLTVYSGSKAEVDAFHAQEILEALIKQVTERTGLFARRLQPSGLPDAPGGGGFFGWGASAGGGFERTDESTKLHIEVNAQYTRDQELGFGMSFPLGGKEMQTYVKNLTDSDKPFPTSADFLKISALMAKCSGSNIRALKKLRDDGYIDAQQYIKYSDLAIDRGCNYNAPDMSLAALSSKTPTRTVSGSKWPSAGFLSIQSAKTLKSTNYELDKLNESDKLQIKNEINEYLNFKSRP